MRRSLLVVACVAFVALVASPSVAAPPPPPPPPPPVVELWTIGPGDDIFSRFGHAALCVLDERSPDGRCYNYGTAAFDDAPGLISDFLRGRARFFVSVSSRDEMERDYAEEDRTIWLQRLPLAPAAATLLAARLEHDARPEHRVYRYHHIDANCSTKVRDQVDIATAGALSAGMQLHDDTLRAVAREAFASDPVLAPFSELLLGRRLDIAPRAYEAMSVPDLLRRAVTDRLGVHPVVLRARTEPLPPRARLGGPGALLVAAGLLSLLAAGAGFAPARFIGRLLRSLLGLLLGLAALMPLSLAVLSALPGYAANEVLLVLLPSDLLLGALVGRRLVVYLALRVALLILVCSAALAGVLVQPLVAPLLVAFGPLIVLLVAERIRTDHARVAADAE